jgi:hypothetical protein
MKPRTWCPRPKNRRLSTRQNRPSNSRSRGHNMNTSAITVAPGKSKGLLGAAVTLAPTRVTAVPVLLTYYFG